MERRTPELRIGREVLEALVEVLEPGVGVRGATLLSGGLANTNYRVETGKGARVLRLVTRNPASAAKEVLLLRELSGLGVPVPRLLAHASAGQAGCPAPALWQELLPGKTLEEAIPELDRNGSEEIGRALGEVTGRVHARRFEEGGDLVVRGGKLVVSPWTFDGVEPEGTLLERYVSHCLDQTPARARLGSLTEQVRSFARQVSERWQPPPPCLVHADFKPCNLFVEKVASGWTLRGILDWEFAHAGSPYSDYGNLFRLRDPALPAGFETAFVEGLGESGVELPRDWAIQRACADLTSALDFLSSERDLPARHAASLSQVRATLALPLSPEGR